VNTAGSITYTHPVLLNKVLNYNDAALSSNAVGQLLVEYNYAVK